MKGLSGRRKGVPRPAAGLLAIALFACALASAATRSEQEVNAWDRLLQAVGLTRSSCRFDTLDMEQYGGGEYRLPVFNAVHQDPLRIPFYARVVRESILEARMSQGSLVTSTALRTGRGTRLNLLGDPLAKEAEQAAGSDQLMKALKAVWLVSGRALPPNERQKLAAAVQSVPADVQRLAAFVLLAELRALTWRKKAFEGVDRAALESAFKALTAPPTNEDTEPPVIEKLLRGADLASLLVGGELLAFAMDRAGEFARSVAGDRIFRCELDTPMGRISLRGGGNDVYASGTAYLLIIDTGGNDTYRAGGGTPDVDHPVSVVLDVAGDDHYIELTQMDSASVALASDRKTAHRTPVFGSGVLGYGLLTDMKGDDTYRALGSTQGCGLFGVGVLADEGGSDRYDCYSYGQGSATFGVGVLADGGGKDEYRCFLASQGYGGTLGSGLLADFGNDDDRFEANDSVLDFPSPQTAEHNANLAQGFGYGVRADYTDGHSRAGGVGILLDEGGNNTFQCGLFGQGAGYWYGLGMLLTGSGDDAYQGVWYVQGSAAHFAVGVLADAGGNDRYQASMNMAQGAGHDFSVGFLLDRAGNDRYEAPNLSLGGGNANGMGLFWDVSGDDTYVVRPSTTLGRASIEASGQRSIRARNLTLGLFLDSGGRDAYPQDIAAARNDALWTMAGTGPPPLASARGAGLDIEARNTPEPP